MKTLSIFVDESGDFGKYSIHSPYYIVVMVLHDQSKNISSEIKKLNTALLDLGYKDHVIHTAPLIRREEDYKNLSPNERRNIFSKLYYFASKCEIQYKSFIFQKKEFNSQFQLEERITREISSFINENIIYFQRFEKVILYYDNGQHELSQVLNAGLSTGLTTYETRKVLPHDYKLFQVADLICTLELLRLKISTGNLTRSETLIFHSKRDLKKDFINKLHKKAF